MNIQTVKRGAKITLYNGIYLIILGILTISFEKFNMTLIFELSSEPWGFFSTYNPEIARLFFLFNLLIGALLISIGIVFIYLSYFIIKRKEKMTWVILFISGIICWAGLLIIAFFLKNWIIISLMAFGWLMFVLGMLIPINYYIQKEYKEY